MKKQIILILSVILACFLLTGCIRVERGIEFQSKGMVTVSEKVTVQQGLSGYGMYTGANSNYLQEMGFDVDASNFHYEVKDVTETVDNTNYEGVCAYTTIPESDAEEALEEIMGDDVTVTITRSGFLLKHIVIDVVNNSSTANTNVAKYTGGGSGSMMGMADIFVIKTPSLILSTNGDKNTKDIRTVIFDLTDFDSDRVSEVHMEVTYLNLLPVIIGGVGVLCIVAMIIILVVVNQKKKKNTTEPLML